VSPPAKPVYRIKKPLIVCAHAAQIRGMISPRMILFTHTDSGVGDRFYQRRRQLAKKVGLPLILTAVPTPLGHPIPWVHVHTPIHQDPLFLYLTGINQPGCVLYCDADTDYLFLPKQDPKHEFWEGHRLSCDNPDDALTPVLSTSAISLACIHGSAITPTRLAATGMPQTAPFPITYGSSKQH